MGKRPVKNGVKKREKEIILEFTLKREVLVTVKVKS